MLHFFTAGGFSFKRNRCHRLRFLHARAPTHDIKMNRFGFSRLPDNDNLPYCPPLVLSGYTVTLTSAVLHVVSKQKESGRWCAPCTHSHDVRSGKPKLYFAAGHPSARLGILRLLRFFRLVLDVGTNKAPPTGGFPHTEGQPNDYKTSMFSLSAIPFITFFVSNTITA